MNTVTWSGTQADAVAIGLRKALGNKMVVDFFDDTEKEALQLLLVRAEVGYKAAVTAATN